MNCIRCKRDIDPGANLCPFCNWDQARTPPAREFVPEQVANYKPPEETSLRMQVLFAGAGALILVASFFVGVVINNDDATKPAQQTLGEQTAERIAAGAPHRAQTTLIPTNERGGIEEPITSAPSTEGATGATDGDQRADATAVSSIEYAEMAKRVTAEKQHAATTVDPRSITGSPYVVDPIPKRTLPAPMTSGSPEPASQRTVPVLEYRALPRIAARGSARLTLLVEPSGRVGRVDIERPLSGNNAQLLAAVQRWRFKPATENGNPVAAPYSVEISFDR